MDKKTNAASDMYGNCGMMNGSNANSHGVMEGRIPVSMHEGMMNDSYGKACGMMPAMAGMMGMMSGQMYCGADHSGLSCPYRHNNAQLQSQKEEK